MIYLKFADRAEFETVMADYFTQDTETDAETGEVTLVGEPYLIGKWKSQTHGHMPRQWEIWAGVTISRPTGETTTDAEGNEVPVMEIVAGYHVNFAPKAGAHPLEEWTEGGWLIEPNSPAYV